MKKKKITVRLKDWAITIIIGVIIGIIVSITLSHGKLIAWRGVIMLTEFLDTPIDTYWLVLSISISALIIAIIAKELPKRYVLRSEFEKLNSLKSEIEDKLPQGCEYLVKDMVIKNVLKHLHAINVICDDKKNVIQWTMSGYGGEAKLSDLLYHVLKDRIIKGDMIDKTLFDSIDHRFYEKVVQHSSSDTFAYFLRDLKDDIDRQRKYGCLKLLATLREVGKNE